MIQYTVFNMQINKVEFMFMSFIQQQNLGQRFSQ